MSAFVILRRKEITNGLNKHESTSIIALFVHRKLYYKLMELIRHNKRLSYNMVVTLVAMESEHEPEGQS